MGAVRGFTPGPWEVLRSNGREWPDKRLSVAADVRVGRARSIAISPRYPDKDLEANFCLIAAAPDLLDALERTLGNFQHLLASRPVRDATETIEEARSAIAKARGES